MPAPGRSECEARPDRRRNRMRTAVSLCILTAVKRPAARLLALALLWIAFPGTMEASENLVHLFQRGHLAHAAESGDSHSEPRPEDGCDGLYHLCSCHLTFPGLTAGAKIAPLPGLNASLFVERTTGRISEHQHDIEHPPPRAAAQS